MNVGANLYHVQLIVTSLPLPANLKVALVVPIGFMNACMAQSRRTKDPCLVHEHKQNMSHSPAVLTRALGLMLQKLDFAEQCVRAEVWIDEFYILLG